MPHAAVDDMHLADATAKRITDNDGKLIAEPWDVPGVGRMTMALDSTGGAFGIITPPAKG